MDAHTQYTAAPATSPPAWHLMLKMLCLVAAVVVAAVVATFTLVPSSASADPTVGQSCTRDGTIVAGGRGGTIVTRVVLDVESGEVAAAIEGWPVAPGALPVEHEAPFTIVS
ncbi:MAG: hypothetical protein AAGA42_13130 [Actinomycetota bacterium]